MNPMRTYTIVVEPEDGGGYFVTVPALPGCFTRGSTIDECRERAVEAIEVHIAGLQADGEPVPNEVGAPQLLAVTVAAWQRTAPRFTTWPAETAVITALTTDVVRCLADVVMTFFTSSRARLRRADWLARPDLGIPQGHLEELDERGFAR
jgi:antitoxin HicB